MHFAVVPTCGRGVLSSHVFDEIRTPRPLQLNSLAQSELLLLECKWRLHPLPVGTSLEDKSVLSERSHRSYEAR